MKNTFPWCSCVLFLFLSFSGFAQIIISGNAHTLGGNGVENVTVTISGDAISPMTTTTDANGDYSFAGLPNNEEYKVCLDKDIDPLNGVSTFDLVLGSKHILGIAPFSSPYDVIAADVSGNGVVTVLDMMLIRRLILFVESSFSAVPSWRFIPADFIFPVPSNPFASPFPERCKCVSASGNVTDVNFIAVKSGDLNGSASPN